MSNIIGIKALTDNYIWAIHSPASSEVIVVDPGIARPVLSYLKKHHLNLKAILLTHHHGDHSGGIKELLTHFPALKVYGSKIEATLHVNCYVEEGDIIDFPNFSKKFQVMLIPGHTRGHIAFKSAQEIFCGDTLFSYGCGRIFEGTAAQMLNSLTKLASLPSHLKIYCGHEYTLANLNFACMIEPYNAELKEKRAQIQNLRFHNLPTLPSLLVEELRFNPFLRCQEKSIKEAVESHWQIQSESIVEIFHYLREWKNSFNS